MSLIFRAGVEPIRYPQIQALANCKDLVVAGASDTTTSSTADTFTSSTVSFSKYDDDSRLRVDFHATCYSTSATTVVEFAVNINSTNWPVAHMLLSIANSHQQCSGIQYIDDIPAGTYTVTPKWRRVSGAGTLTSNSDDHFSMALSECRE